MENTFHGFVSSTFNPDYLLLVIIISGVLNIFTPENHESLEKEKKPGPGDYVLIFILSLGGAALVYYKTKELGDISWILSIFTVLIILVLGFVLLWPDKHLTKD